MPSSKTNEHPDEPPPTVQDVIAPALNHAILIWQQMPENELHTELHKIVNKHQDKGSSFSATTMWRSRWGMNQARFSREIPKWFS